MGRARIFDVAAAAGVSVTTVSLVLNNAQSRISEDTRQRVREAADAVGYSASAVARGLRTQRTRIVGLISDQIATTPFAGRMLAGAQDAARENGHMVMLVDTGGDADVETEAVRAMTAQQVDAVLYAAMWHRAATAPVGLPHGTVMLDCYPAAGGFRSVVPDDRAGEKPPCASSSPPATPGSPTSTRSTRNRSPPACVTTATSPRSPRPASRPIPPSTCRARRRRRAGGSGRSAARPPRGPAPDRDLLLQRPHGDRRVHRRPSPRPRHPARPLRRRLRRPAAGRRGTRSPLTTIALPHYEMGRWAMEVALGVRAEGDEDAAHRMECPVVRRDSVGPPPAQVAKRDRRRASHATEGPRSAAPIRYPTWASGTRNRKPQ